MNILLIDLADKIFRDLDQPENLSIPQISYWLRYNIGQLNVLLSENIIFDEDGIEFDPILTIEQANIYEHIYFVKYYSDKVSNSLGAASYDQWIEVSEGDTTIRQVNKNEMAKTYKSMRDGYRDDLENLVFLYKHNQIKPADYGVVHIHECDLY